MIDFRRVNMSQPPKKICDQVDARDEHSCTRCGRSLYSAPGSRHHRKLRSQGGKHLAEVLILLCGSGTTDCHGWVHANPDAAREEGFYVRAWEDCADIPIKHALHGWCKLNRLGGVEKCNPPEQGAT